MCSLKVTAIRRSGQNPRKDFDLGELRDLAESIRVHGLLEPLVVRPVEVKAGGIEVGLGKFLNVTQITESDLTYWDSGQVCYTSRAEFGNHYGFDILRESIWGYEIICGERRWRAAQLAGLEKVPSSVREDVDDRKALELALVENLARQDINPIEEAEAYAKLMEMGYKQTEVAERANRSQPAIANAVRLLGLPEEVRAAVAKGKLSPSHGKALCSYVDYPDVLAAQFKRACSGATSKELESLTYQTYRSLVDAGVVAVLELEVGTTRECANCPDKRRVKESGYEEACFVPACCKEMKAKACKAKEQARLERIPQEVRDAGVLLLDSMRYAEEWVHLKPEICAEDSCENIKQGWWQGDVCRVCTDCKCYHRKQKEVEKARKKERQAVLKEKHDVMLARLADPKFLNCAVAIVALELLPRVNGYAPADEKKRAERVLKPLGINLEGAQGSVDCVVRLQYAKPAGLVLALAEYILRGELDHARENEYRSTVVLDWFTLGDACVVESVAAEKSEEG
jgi:ParB/RepB/Spo0J family partition protein